MKSTANKKTPEVLPSAMQESSHAPQLIPDNRPVAIAQRKLADEVSKANSGQLPVQRMPKKHHDPQKKKHLGKGAGKRQAKASADERAAIAGGTMRHDVREAARQTRAAAKKTPAKKTG